MKMYKLLFMIFIMPSSLLAQDLGFSSLGGDINISAQDGVIWDRAKQEIQINKQATMIQGGTTLVADVITINYDEINGKQNISLLNAVGNTTISTETEVLKGDNALYEPNKGLAVLKGKNANLSTKDGIIYAPIFEYFKTENRVVARDNISLISEKGTVKAKTGVAHLADAKTKTKINNSISKLDLFDNVVISTTANEIIKGDKGVYNIAKGTIVLEGNVIIQKGKNILKGDIGEVNLSSGISKLRSKSGKKVGGTVSAKK